MIFKTKDILKDVYKRQELDGYYGVYETMTEYLNEYIDGFYKSSKDSLLHRYIRTHLVDGFLYEAVIENTPEEYVLCEHNEALFNPVSYTHLRAVHWGDWSRDTTIFGRNKG